MGMKKPFTLEARDRAGRLRCERIVAADLRQAHARARERGWFVIRVTDGGDVPSEHAAFASDTEPGSGRFSRSRRKELPEKTEQMARLLRAGMPLGDVLAALARESAHPVWRRVFEDLKGGVMNGRTLSAAMSARPEVFDPMFVSMVAAGEAAGRLAEVLERVAGELENREAIRQRVTGALVYPAIIVSAGLMTVAFFMLVMLPRLSAMFKDMGQALPLPTQVLVWTSGALTRWGWAIPVVTGVVWAGWRRWLGVGENRERWDASRLRWPLAGRLISLAEFSRLSRTLHTLLRSGVKLVEALGVAEATLRNQALGSAVRAAGARVRDGSGLVAALREAGLFPPGMLDMLAVGERTGDLAGALEHAAQAQERELDRAIRTFTSLVEPVLIVTMAAFVGGIVFSVLMAVFDLTSGIGRM